MKYILNGDVEIKGICLVMYKNALLFRRKKPESNTRVILIVSMHTVLE